VKLVSGGLRPAILPLTECVHLDADDLFAVDVSLDGRGDYMSFDATSPLTTASGKQTIVEALRFRRPAIAVGDASTDLAMRPAVDCFACFTGFRYREAIVRQADVVVASFDELLRIVLPS
jgi:phosphoserine phosphatase